MIYLVIFFLIIDYLIPISFIIFYPLCKIISNKKINQFVGFRTAKSMLNENNWKKANLLFGKYSLYLGILSVILTTIIKIIKPFSIETNSLLLVFITLFLMILLCIFVNKKI